MITRNGLILIVQMVFFLNIAFAGGGGSSGVGNQLLNIVPGVDSFVANPKAYAKSGDHIVDAKTGEKLVRIEHLKKIDLNRYKAKLVKSRLGSLSGFEYLPSYSDKMKENFWAICLTDDDCVRFIPESDTNLKVQSIIGGLRRSK